MSDRRYQLMRLLQELKDRRAHVDQLAARKYEEALRLRCELWGCTFQQLEDVPGNAEIMARGRAKLTSEFAEILDSRINAYERVLGLV